MDQQTVEIDESIHLQKKMKKSVQEPSSPSEMQKENHTENV